MNPSSLSETRTQKCSTTALADTAKIQTKKRQQKQQSYRNPFRDLNNDTTSNAAAASSSSSSKSSTEAPKGCLRFFLSHSSSTKATPFNHLKRIPFKTPKSAPNIRPTINNRYKPVSHQVEKFKHSCLYKWQSGKNPSSGNISSSTLSSVLDPGGILANKNMRSGDAVCDFDAATPLSRVAVGCGSDRADEGKIVAVNGDEKSNTGNNTNSASSKTKTPPVQASVSPEIQYGSSVLSRRTDTETAVTPAYYGAGLLLSGVGDNRKCRARGILTIGETKALGSFDSDDVDSEKENAIRGDAKSSVPTLPPPVHASVHWLLSPCNEEDEGQKFISPNSSCNFQRLNERAILNTPEPLSGNKGFILDSCNSSICRGTSTTSTRRKRNDVPLDSSSELLQGFLGPPLYDELTNSSPEEERKDCYVLDAEQSPFSMGSLGSRNVIQTPESGSSSGRRADVAWLNTDGKENNRNFDSKLTSAAEHLHMANLSSTSHAPIRDIASSSFQFDCVTAPSNSVDLSHFQKFPDDRASWFSSSVLEDASQSQMRISWREGLKSRILEMDEFDRCRCLSDDEDDAIGCKSDHLKHRGSPRFKIDAVSGQVSTNAFGSMDFLDKKSGNDETAKEEVTCSYAESISTDEGDLVCSEDSYWTLCYKNLLFQV